MIANGLKLGETILDIVKGCPACGNVHHTVNHNALVTPVDIIADEGMSSS